MCNLENNKLKNHPIGIAMFKKEKRGCGMVKWSSSQLAASRVCGSNPAQGEFVVGFIVCLCR